MEFTMTSGARDQHNPVAEGSGRPGSGRRGVAIIEFALILPLLMILMLATIDLGLLTQARLIISNVCREGGSITSRQTNIDPTIPNLLAASARPLDLAGADGRVYITRIIAGTGPNATQPTVTTRLTLGGLGRGSSVGGGVSLGLSQDIFDHLVYNTAQGSADITNVTVVEVYFKYRPITGISKLIPDLMLKDGDGTIVGSKAIF
jgi:hypothetical protein